MSMRRSFEHPGRTSSFSGTNGDCVQIRCTDDGVEVADTKHPETPPILCTRSEWVAFWLGVQSGEFEPPAEWVADLWAARDHQTA